MGGAASGSLAFIGGRIATVERGRRATKCPRLASRRILPIDADQGSLCASFARPGTGRSIGRRKPSSRGGISRTSRICSRRVRRADGACSAAAGTTRWCRQTSGLQARRRKPATKSPMCSPSTAMTCSGASSPDGGGGGGLPGFDHSPRLALGSGRTRSRGADRPRGGVLLTPAGAVLPAEVTHVRSCARHPSCAPDAAGPRGPNRLRVVRSKQPGSHRLRWLEHHHFAHVVSQSRGMAFL